MFHHITAEPLRPGPSATGRLDAALMLHLAAVGGTAPHAALLRWARDLGYAEEELDRCLVRAGHAEAIDVDVGEPPCTATRVVRLVEPGRAR